MKDLRRVPIVPPISWSRDMLYYLFHIISLPFVFEPLKYGYTTSTRLPYFAVWLGFGLALCVFFGAAWNRAWANMERATEVDALRHGSLSCWFSSHIYGFIFLFNLATGETRFPSDFPGPAPFAVPILFMFLFLFLTPFAMIAEYRTQYKRITGV